MWCAFGVVLDVLSLGRGGMELMDAGMDLGAGFRMVRDSRWLNL